MVRILPLLVAGLLLGGRAHAGSWSLGAHLGFVSLHSDVKGSASTDVLAAPANALTYEPGLRLGFGDRLHSREVVLDWGTLHLDEGGSPLTLVVAMASYQHTFRASETWAPFTVTGMGLYRERAVAHTSNSTRYGIGAGVRRTLREGHGALRAELRGDHLQADDRSGRPKLTTFAVRLGFDVWL